MKRKLLSTKVRLLLSASLLALSPQVFSDAGSIISNTASISYDVNNSAQTAINSHPDGNNIAGATEGGSTDIMEDQLINFAVYTIDADDQPAVPNSAADHATHKVQFMVYNVGGSLLDGDGNALTADSTTDTDNVSNGRVTLQLSTANINGADSPHSSTQDFDTGGNCTIYDDTGAPITDNKVTLLPGESQRVDVSCDIPDPLLSGKISSAIELRATATHGVDDPSNPGTPLAITATDNSQVNSIAGLEFVFADDGKEGDGTENNVSIDYSAFIIKAPILTVAKTVTVVSDPINGTNNPKAIPGSVLEYTITVENEGDYQGDAVNISDTLPGTLECDATFTPTLSSDSGNHTTSSCSGVNAAASCGTIDATVDPAPNHVCTLVFRAKIK